MSAAARLYGLTLANGWTVTRHIEKSPNGTGGTFSESYEVQNGGRKGFLKAFDFSEAFGVGADTVYELQKLLDSYDHERDILDICSINKLSKVVVAVDHGSAQVPNMGTMEGRVYYLVFELADGDVRVQMDINKKFEVLLSVKAIRDVSLGLHQVHKQMIAHQDTKPSNVLTYSDDSFKIADFGRSSRRDRSARHDNFVVAGDPTYAPPELIYGFTHPEFIPRRMGCDLYMLGNLSGFLFTGVNMTASLLAKLDPQHHPRNWAGGYQDVLPYLQNAFTAVLNDVSPLIDLVVRDDMIKLIGELCNPDISFRGHSKGIGTPSQYSLQRYVSYLDVVAKRLAVRLRADGRKAA